MAYNFDGTASDTVTTPNTTVLQNPDTAVTLGCWVYITNNPGSYARLIGKGFSNYSNAPYVSYNIQQKSTSTRQFEFNIGINVTAYSSGTLATALSTNTWYFLAGRWSSGNAVECLAFGADGALVTSASAGSPSGSIRYDTTEFMICGEGDATPYIAGNVSDVLLASTSYTDEQIKSFAFSNIPAGAVDLLVPLTHSTAVDISGNDAAMTKSGTSMADGPPMVRIPQEKMALYVVDTGSVVNNVTVSDNIDVTDPQSRRTIDTNLIDEISIEDSSTFTLLRSVIDTVSVSDLDLPYVLRMRERLSNILTSDSAFLQLHKNLSDGGLDIYDSRVFSRMATRVDTIDITDLIVTAVIRAGAVIYEIVKSDALTVSDSRYKQEYRHLLDAIDTSDSLIAFTGKLTLVTLLDSLDVSDDFLIKLFKSMEDNVSITDTFIPIVLSRRLLQEAIALSDSASASLVAVLDQVVELIEAMIVSKHINIAVEDSLTIEMSMS